MTDADKIYREAFNQFQQENAEKRSEQEQQRREAEIELLDSSTNMYEFIERRRLQRSLVVNPDMPLDEMSMGDYIKTRKGQKLSYSAYLKSLEDKD